MPCVRIQQDPGKPPIIVQCLKIQQDCRQRGESFFAMYQNTTRLQATGENLSNWSHQWFGNVWKYNKIAGNREKILIIEADSSLAMYQNLEATNDLAMFENTARLQATGGEFQLLWKPPVIWPCVRIQQDSRQATNNCAMSENTTRLQATGENGSYWSHPVWKYNKIPGKPPVSLQCLKI